MMGLEALTALAEAIPSIWDKIEAFRGAKMNKDGILIAYRYEVRANLDLIQELNFNALKDADISGAAFRNFILCLQTQVGASILYDTNRKNNRDFTDSLKAKVHLVPEDEGGEKEPVESLKEAMRFSVKKIEHLKRLALCTAEGGDLFRDFRLKARVNNIRESLLLIAKHLPPEAT